MLLCPSCPTSERVWCAVLGADFWHNAGVALLPFALIAGLTFFVHRAGSSDA